VVYSTRQLSSYRVPFLNRVRELLGERDVSFEVYFGSASGQDLQKGDDAELSWASTLRSRRFHLGPVEFWWDPIVWRALTTDLMVTEQASKQLANVPLSVLQRCGLVRHALWGHGVNFQIPIESGRGEGLKRWFTSAAHWFFAYTTSSEDALVELGFPPDRITTFCNSTDVEGIRATLSESAASALRGELGIVEGPVVGFIGGLYPPKRPEFLLASLDEMRSRLPHLNAIIIGGGSQAGLAEEFSQERPWLHYLGPRYDDDRVHYGQLFDVMVMPGLVGLNVVDAFALGVPTATTAVDYHSPEFVYLEDGANGIVIPATEEPEGFASAVVELLQDPPRLQRLKQGAWASGDQLGTEQMAERFVDGVISALEAPRRSLFDRVRRGAARSF
jgi:glycosyltransferase involved in cell wall biosynthesis